MTNTIQQYNTERLKELDLFGAKVEYHDSNWAVLFDGEAIVGGSKLDKVLDEGIAYLQEHYVIETKTVILSKDLLF